VTKDLDERAIDTLAPLPWTPLQRELRPPRQNRMALARWRTRVPGDAPARHERPHWAGRDRFGCRRGTRRCCCTRSSTSRYGLFLDEITAVVPAVGFAHAGHPEHGHTIGRGRRRPRSARASGTPSAGDGACATPPRDGTRRATDCSTRRCTSSARRRLKREGVSREAASLASISDRQPVVVWDDNTHISIEGDNKGRVQRGRGRRFAAYGFHTSASTTAEDRAAIRAEIEPARDRDRTACFIACAAKNRRRRRTRWTRRGARLGARRDEVRLTRKILGPRPDEHFAVAEEVLAPLPPGGRARPRAARGVGRALQRWPQAHPDRAAERERVLARRLPGTAGRRSSRRSKRVRSVRRPARHRQVSSMPSQSTAPSCRRQRDLAGSNKHIDGRRLVHARDARGPGLQVRHPRARDGLDDVNGMVLAGGVPPPPPPPPPPTPPPFGRTL